MLKCRWDIPSDRPSLLVPKDLVLCLVGEPHHLVLNRRTIAWPPPLDLAGVNWRPIQICPDQVVARGICIGDVAIDLRIDDLFRQIGKWFRLRIGALSLEPGPVYGAPVQPRRAAGLQAAHGKAQTVEPF